MAHARGPLKPTESPVFKERHFFAVGLFILLVTAIGGYFVIWLAVSKEPDDVRRYSVEFQGSVRGLTKGSQVRYKGLKVGRVYDIRLVPDNGDHIEVLLDIRENTPLRTTTVASVEMQGLTGLSFVSLSPGKEPGEPLDHSQPGPPKLQARESQFDKLMEGAPALLEEVTQVTRNVNKLFSDDNVRHISSILAQADQAAAGLTPALDELTQLLKDTRQTITHLNATAQSLNRTTQTLEPDIVATVENVEVTARNLARISEQLESMVSENRDGVTQFVNEALPEFSLLISESRLAAQEIQELADSLQRNPSQIIIPANVERLEIDP